MSKPYESDGGGRNPENPADGTRDTNEDAYTNVEGISERPGNCGLAAPEALQSAIANPQSREVFDDPLDDNVQAVFNAVRSLSELPPDFEDFVHADVRGLFLQKSGTVRSRVCGAARSSHSMSPTQADRRED